MIQPDNLLTAAQELWTATVTDRSESHISPRVAAQLQSWGASGPLLAAGLLHDFVYNGRLAVEAVRAVCGEHTAFLCSAYCCTAEMLPPPNWCGQSHALRRIQLYMAAYRHPELALLCIARLWAELFSDAQAPLRDDAHSTGLHVQRKQAGVVLGPALEMMGMEVVRQQLDEMLQVADDGGRHQLPSTDDLLDQVRFHLTHALPTPASVLVEAHPSLRAERGQGSVQATDRQGGHQSLSLRIVVSNEEACYAALHTLHRLYHPLDGTLCDTLYRCRTNGHRSLQTAVMASASGRPLRLNIHICTTQMEQVNRWGVAAFYLHPDESTEAPPGNLTDDIYSGAWWWDVSTKWAAIESGPLGSLNSEVVHVFSPSGEIFSFARGSTVVDYAYHVHSDLAEQCQRFYVNGETVEPATLLRHLDLVELEHSPKASGPTVAWLNAARTKRARTRIRRYLRNLGQGVNDGRRIVDARLQALEEHYGFHIPEHRIDETIARAAHHLRVASTNDLLAELAAGRLTADRFLHPLFAEEIVRRIELPGVLRLRLHQVTLAQCCKPRPGDDIVGHPHRREGIITKLTVHRRDCARERKIDPVNREEEIALRWRLQRTTRSLAQVEMTARDDDGLLGEALAQIYAHLPRITLLRSEAQTRRGIARLRFNVDADSQETLDEIVDALRRLPGREVSAVRLLTLPPSEQDALVADNARATNPYSRLPVNDSTMFFGRTEELERMDDWLRNGVACIWLRGQKRVGKTSLLLQLRRHFGESHEFVCAFVDFQLLANLAQANLFFEVASAVFDDLQGDPRVLALGAPDRSQFASDAPMRLVHYLRQLQSRLGGKRLVFLFDEFSRITDLYLAGAISADFFQQWRGLLQATGRWCSFVTVVQQKTFDRMLEHMRTQQDDPCWHVLELGETIQLRPLTPDDARRLIVWPMRNFLDYGPGAVERMMQLTGASPFLIHSFCNKLVTRQWRRTEHIITLADVEEVAEEFMQPSESIFAHLLDLIHGLGHPVTTKLAMLAGDHAQGRVKWSDLCIALPEIAPPVLRATLDQLCLADILNQPESETWRFNNTLFQRWLVRNS